MDFAAWIEVWLGDRWWTFDARHNVPRIGRVLIATGRDATDVAISTSFGSASLTHFEVVTDVPAARKTAYQSSYDRISGFVLSRGGAAAGLTVVKGR